MTETCDDYANHLREEITRLTPCVHGARLKEASDRTGIPESELLDFSSNQNLLHIDVTEPLTKACKYINQYPDSEYMQFRATAADFVGVFPENIIPGNGSTELIRLFAETVIKPKDTVVIPVPTFGEYENQCRLMGANIIYQKYEEMLTITDRQLSGVGAVFVCNPNNPTGTLIEREQLLTLADRCARKKVFLFVDEAFIELSDPGYSIATYVLDCEFLFVLRSLTKAFAVPGLRIGFGVAPITLAEYMNVARLTWNLNCIADTVGEWLLKHGSKFLYNSRDVINAEREWFHAQLAHIRGFKPLPSRTNFILVDTSDFPLTVAELAKRLLLKCIVIRDCTSFELKNHIRLAVRAHKENITLIQAIEQISMEWGEKIGKKSLEVAIKQGQTANSRISCEYYPCHFEGQDCTFCFCPFYPCEDTRTGGEYIKRASGSKVWSCMNCQLVHKPEVASKILDELLKGSDVKKTWKRVMEPLL